MRQSQLFTKTRKHAPKDEVAKNAQLLIRGGFIHKEMAGVYSYLPLGLRVFKRIEQIIREEMNAIGGQEMTLTALQSPAAWKKTGRWDDAAIDVWFKTELKGGGELGLGTTHEEPLTELMTEYVESYKDLPKYVYQFQTKFRNEMRAKSGIMRTREFVMKDLYSFSRSEEEFREFYEKCAAAYMKIFKRVGLGEQTFRTFASGGSFSKFSDEFQTLSDAGEDTIHLHRGKGIAVNKEVYTDEVLAELGIEKSELEEVKAIEVGNIFPLGTRFSDALGLKFKDEKGNEQSVVMGCYGIGPGRLMGTIVEVLSDEKGIVWPKEVAPFRVHLISISGGNADVVAEADRLYELLNENGVEALYDDRESRAGEKFADADLIGIPMRIVVSEKTMAEGGVELSGRHNGGTAIVSEDEVIKRIRA
ncbi:prolyl-tRNA synthetase [Candidatus Kaiserbacteria bacterium RIFCSPHIGHO2_02_FULL_54_11b]|uniref:Proline--tRNA ligase n=2 Tax=Candidatus Kaiseribacteriota TaxID=1752734 RepID=A0A1F6CHP9_9BACT|nr:MAG: prolyl-tRNA synthetase [Candidatus Kaiserbacteria bacterium RIFCSPHIGHO2_01_FULL_54_36b]OGG64012.1 MAG: prolyl-tRNA synthetase [Candidatus Kaiserbacteria bacterium RIFCSPHIGHO2_02_FULL_54_11b]